MNPIAVGMGAAWGSSPAPLERAGTVPSRAGPHFLGRNGERTPEERGSSLWTPPSGVGLCGGGCTSCGIPGLRPSQRKARNGPPTGWAGWEREAVPFGRRQRGTVWFPAFSSRQQTTSPARRAGGRAMGVGLGAAGQAHHPNHLPPFLHQRMGFQEGTSLPLGVLSISSKK